MAYDTNILFRLQPIAGDTVPTDKVDSTAMATTGSITLVDVGAEKAWNFPAASNASKSSVAHTVQLDTPGTGVTLVVRYRYNNRGSDNFDEIIRVGAGVIDMEKNGRDNMSFRTQGTLGGKNVPEGGITGNVITLTCRMTMGVSPTADNNEVWVGGLARAGDNPNYTSVTPYNLAQDLNVSSMLIQALGTMNIDILDLVLYSGEKTNAECAQLADNLRTVLPASGGPVVTPISFAGNIANQTFTAGDVVNVNLATGNYAGTETPFTYANVGTALTGTGLSISSAGVLTGTATTQATVTGVIMSGTDAATNTANSNAFSVTVNAPAAQVPQGTVTIGTITKTDTTASVPYSYNDTDQTGFEYRIDGGAAVTASASPISLTGLTQSTAYTIEVRAINGAGAGTWSAAGNFTTDAAQVSDPVFTSDPLKDNTNGNLLINEPLDYVALYDNTTGALVLRVTGLSTDASGVFTVQNAALTAGVIYKPDWKVTSQAQGRMPSKAAV